MTRTGWSDEEAATIRTEARRQVDEAERIVQSISRHRLAELRRGPHAAAANAVDDPALTPADRQALVQHLAGDGRKQASERRSPRRNGSGRRILRLLARLLPRVSFRMGIVGSGLVAAAVPLGLAWQATPLGRVTLARDSIVRWHRNGTYVGMVGYSAGSKFDLVQNDAQTGGLVVRGWMPQNGYLTGAVSSSDLRTDRTR